ncbi:MAG: CDP-alcohol phosphatidyltransferase [Pseudolysinimonas sp.]
MTPPTRRWPTVVAIVLLVALPLLPGVLATGSPAALVRLPVESVIAILVLALVPWRPARTVIAAVFGAFVVVALALAGLDAAFRYALDVHFDPNDWRQVGDGFGVVADSIGMPAAIVVLVLVAVVAIAAAFALAWAALRVDAAVRGRQPHGRAAITTVAAGWIVASLAGSQLVAGQPAAASASLDSLTSAASIASETASAQEGVEAQIRDDPYQDVPASDLLASLMGKDVIIAFVESYGYVALHDESISGGVVQVLHDGDAQLAAGGYSSQSAWLTSPTFGGVSWLAHSTLQSGLWINKQSIYDRVVETDRLTLSEAFRRAGWNTVSDSPSDTHPWSVGTSFYHYETLLDTNNVEYHGPAFGYARIPDQYTWKYFSDHFLDVPHEPVMAEIDLISSHTPWAPLPALVPWDEIGDGSIYSSQLAGQDSTSDVWSDPARIKKAYGQSVEYALGALFSFVENSDDPNLVLIVVGDHQPAAVVSGDGASRDVPISVISKDPAVFEAIAGWRWEDGMLPSDDAPLWRMDEFRDRFLAAFSASE